MSETVNATSRTRRWWNENEDRTLRREAERQLSQGAVKDWNRIAAKLPGRTNKDCRKRWSKLSECLRKGAWTAEEDKRLVDAANQFGLKWTLIAEAVGSRHADQCAKRWQNFLDPSLERLGWTSQDEEKLMAEVQMHGHSWTTIRDLAFPGRSVTDIKNRWVAHTEVKAKVSHMLAGTLSWCATGSAQTAAAALHRRPTRRSNRASCRRATYLGLWTLRWIRRGIFGPMAWSWIRCGA
ncbi:uncharacterized protein K452DRAFT_239086 [Aplosporella prunicola CBS 121167]|uniref:Uncharacterized protein n=1 Tax=Aplosporella prunicola CBS 121167 TaxID=1176127 RepID=A0A6A6AVI2_9PEZI|nr:uncharacterized protein K452DRAFT_239086 [Aplosporella prunicola CBS 121167]KAF2135596.1 hypothetical protein K452DRAFT_239086 [Aplosporella prunicola CBS 121167]